MNKEILTILKLNLQIQSLIHRLDEVSQTRFNTREIKLRANQLSKVLEPVVNELLKNVDKIEADYYISCVKELDDFADGLILLSDLK